MACFDARDGKKGVSQVRFAHIRHHFRGSTFSCCLLDPPRSPINCLRELLEIQIGPSLSIVITIVVIGGESFMWGIDAQTFDYVRQKSLANLLTGAGKLSHLQKLDNQPRLFEKALIAGTKKCYYAQGFNNQSLRSENRVSN